MGVADDRNRTGGITTGWYCAEDCRLEDLRAALVEVTTDAADYPFADGVEQNVLV